MCGIVGVFNHPNAANVAWWALHGLQHRAQDTAGIASTDGDNIVFEGGPGIVTKAIPLDKTMTMPGTIACGQIRYPTTGKAPNPRNIQPIVSSDNGHGIALAHNGNLTNLDELKAELPPEVKFLTGMDTEVILKRYRLAHGESPEERLVNALVGLRGSYSLVMMLHDRIMIARDPSGNRPLALARFNSTYVAASETSAFNMVRSMFPLECRVEVQEVVPGEIISITPTKIIHHHIPQQGIACQRCRFEHIYFAFPTSVVFGRHVATERERLGARLWQEHPVAHADCVIAVPESSVNFAKGYAREGGIPFVDGIRRGHYSDRSFTARQGDRKAKVRAKLHFDPYYINGKVVVAVDDSIVRGNTMPTIVEMLWMCGAKEVHLRIGCPPVTGPCYYGIDTPSREELIANRLSLEGIRDKLRATSLGYLSLESLQALDDDPTKSCYACVNGDYQLGVIQNGCS